jgi:type I restriction enzyme R subunit
VELIVQQGIGAISSLPEGVRKNRKAVAETIVNNVRKTIVDERALNPKYYDRMSSLLDALIDQRNQQAIDYADYLNKLIQLTQQVGKGESDVSYPEWATTPARRALVDFAWPAGVEIDVQHVHDVIQSSKEHDWAGNTMKERALGRALAKAVPAGLDPNELKRLVGLLKEHDEYR